MSLVALILLCVPISLQVKLDEIMEQKFIKEIEDEEIDDRPQELQELEKKLEIEGGDFVNKGLEELRSNMFNPFIPSSFLNFALESQLEDFELYIQSIRGLNKELMKELNKVYKKIRLFDGEIEPEQEIGMNDERNEINEEEIKLLSIGSSSIFDDEPINSIDIISRAMTCRFKVVYAVDWIRVRLGKNIKWNIKEFMSMREDLVKLMGTYKAIEMNAKEYLAAINKMNENPELRDDSKVKKAMSYFKETIEEGKFISMTEDLIKKSIRECKSLRQFVNEKNARILILWFKKSIFILIYISMMILYHSFIMNLIMSCIQK